VTENWGGQEAPVPFAKRVIRKALELDAEIIIEKNHGGAWLQATFQQVMRQMRVSCKYRMIHASHAKRTRAEPVSALYEMHGGLVRHLHPGGTIEPNMSELEDQMATFTGAQGERSPDRLDSLVWALSPFLRRAFGPPGHASPRKWAAAEDIEAAGTPPDVRARRRLAGAHGGVYRSRKWSLEDFAPADDSQVVTTGGPRGNLKGWR
jgi:Terminase RNaseH-like domain